MAQLTTGTVVPAVPVRTPFYEVSPQGDTRGPILSRTWILFFEELVGALTGIGGIAGKIPQPVHEVPKGAIDGTNRVFFLTFAPLGGWLVLHLGNGLQDPIMDYSLAGNKITYTTAPQPSDTHHAWYFGTPQTGRSNPVSGSGSSVSSSTSVWIPRTAASGGLAIQVWDTTAPIPASYTAVLDKGGASCDLLAVLVALNGSPTFVQAASAASGSQTGTSITIAFGSPNKAGNLLLLDIGFYWTGSDTGVTVNDSAGNAWTALIQPLSGLMGAFECRSCKAGANTVTVTVNAAGTNVFQYPVVAITEYAPGATAAPDAITNGLTTGGAALTVSVTTTQIAQFLHLAAFTGPFGSARLLALPPPSPPQ